MDRLKGILRRAGDRYRMHDPTSWADQAKLAAEGRWKELDEFQDVRSRPRLRICRRFAAGSTHLMENRGFH